CRDPSRQRDGKNERQLARTPGTHGGRSARRASEFRLAPAERNADLSSVLRLPHLLLRRELLGLIFLRQGPDELIEAAIDDVRQTVDRQLDAMIGDAPLRKIVGTDPFAAIAGTDLELACLSLLTLLLFLLCSEQPRLEQGKRPGSILVLGAFVLALHDDPGRQVGDAHCGVGLVDVLSAGTRRAIGVDA